MRMRLVVAAGMLVVLAAVGAATIQKHYDRVEQDREAIRLLREQYPFQSLEARLPPPPHHKQDVLSNTALEQLQEFESSITGEIRSHDRDTRLQKLHEGTVEEFVAREGRFGVARIFGGYAQSVLALGHEKDGTWIGRNKTSVPQPSSVFSLTAKEFDLVPIPAESSGFLALHLHNTLHFANRAGFGAIRDRREVAGFQSHQFNELIEEKPWKILRIELVGLLVEDRPRVYVTAELPRMQDIRGVPSRALDAFESAGLEKLYAGDALFVRQRAEGVRMLGPIRSAEQCVACHGGKRGELLGAFSYGLRRER